MNDFTTFGLQPVILQALQKLEFTTPTPIQSEAIPVALLGKDVLGTAGTGTGKTGAFGIPLISHLINNPHDSALIMAPTRELAVQVMDMLRKLLGNETNIKTALLIGGQDIKRQLTQLKMQPRLIVGTPGRINDHIQRRKIDMVSIRFVVLDETDRMLDMGFGIQIDKILAKMPKKRQTLLFSATLPDNILKLTSKYLIDPVRITVGSVSEPVENVKQETIHLTEGERYGELITQLNKRDGSVIVFVKTKIDADKISKKLRDHSHKSAAIHGDLKHSQRSKVILGFRNRENRVLVATDIAARGLDIPHIEHVINYDLPHCPEDYIHRIGRTGRAGAEGEAVNLVTPQDRRRWRAICNLINPEEAAKMGAERKGPRKDDRRGKPNFRVRKSTNDEASPSRRPKRKPFKRAA
jgi:superfamily II DNA/RNA helicase